MPRLTGGQTVVQTLAAAGVRAVFGVPGVHNLDIYDALPDTPQIAHYVVRHEQAATFMADGYARATGDVGVALLITGPGLTNALTGIAEAYSDSSPMLVITAQVETKLADKEKGSLHELRDQLGVSRPVTAYNRRINSVPEIAPAIREAFAYLKRSRPRPIHLEIPTDVMEAAAEVDLGQPLAAAPPAPFAAPIKRAADVLARANRLIIVAGGGCVSSGAGEALAAVAEMLQAPIVVTSNGKGGIPESHPLVLGNLSYDKVLMDLMGSADAVLGVGTRFSAMTTRGFTWPVPAALVHIDIDPAELGRNYPVAVGVSGDARLSLESLRDALRPLVAADRQSRAPEVAEVKQHVRQQAIAQGSWEIGILDDIRRVLAPDDVLVNDMTMLSYAAARYYPAERPHTFMSPRGYGTLGFSYPAALGAQVGRPDRRVLSIAGDGGFLFTGVELCTAAQYNLPVVALIVNNHGYGVVKRNQLRRFGRPVDVDLHTPDYMQFAAAFGVAAERVGGPGEIRGALERAFAARKPYLLELAEPQDKV
ncbi:MAG: thiamine pyrophosphate-binding protein [Bacillota bacterium]|nr:thiamine pyrophosphate-binding protein [Bacillota bacterium]